MSTIDDLIEELFPGKPSGEGAPPPTGSDGGAGTKKQSSWDGNSEGEDEQRPRQPTAAATGSPAPPARRRSVGHNFDDDDSGEECTDGDGKPTRSGMHRPSKPQGGGAEKRGASLSSTGGGTSAKHSSLFMVPFPSASAVSGLPACTNRCFVTNKAADLKLSVPVPTAEELQSVASGKYDAQSSQQQMLLRKGAYYVQSPRIGNGCRDGGVNVPVNKAGGGGCPHMVCRKCNYAVVRLQGAEWVDGGGTVDLYLTTRNYYPDWSRLASSTAVGLPEEEQRELGFALRTNPQCAAYCCQCSWLTVACERGVIETKLSDAASYTSDSNAFATRLPLVNGERRRPPLWACKGHYLA